MVECTLLSCNNNQSGRALTAKAPKEGPKQEELLGKQTRRKSTEYGGTAAGITMGMKQGTREI